MEGGPDAPFFWLIWKMLFAALRLSIYNLQNVVVSTFPGSVLTCVSQILAHLVTDDDDVGSCLMLMRKVSW